jgi:uncharacterized protein YjiK
MAMKIALLILAMLFTACEGKGLKKHLIAKVPEASGICYDRLRNSLFVVNDEGTIYELTTNGEHIRKKDLGDYDLEGITCDVKHDRLLLAVEGKDNILIVNKKTLNPQKEINIERSFMGREVLKKDKKRGLEAITIAPDGTLYLSNQSKYLQPHEDPSVIFTVKDLKSNKTGIKRVIDPRIKDISGLQWYKDALFLVSDTKDRLYRYDLKKEKIDFSLKLPKFAQEGITFDTSGKIYFADDKGKVYVFTKEELGLPF